MNRQFIARHWYADIYEQFEKQTNDVDFLLKVLDRQIGGKPLNILEVACGGGRICVPLAQAGHTVTGFDADEHMLLRCYKRMQGLKNLDCYMADATAVSWGDGFDMVVMAGNILINIESAMDYAEAQEAFIRKAAASLHTGGFLYLDFDLHFNPARFFNRLSENCYFSGTDDMGTSGRTVSYGSVYDPVTHICTGSSHWEITTNNGEYFIISKSWMKHIPTQAHAYEWLAKAGFKIEKTYKNHSNEPLKEPIDESTYRATILARKE